MTWTYCNLWCQKEESWASWSETTAINYGHSKIIADYTILSHVQKDLNLRTFCRPHHVLELTMPIWYCRPLLLRPLWRLVNASITATLCPVHGVGNARFATRCIFGIHHHVWCHYFPYALPHSQTRRCLLRHTLHRLYIPYPIYTLYTENCSLFEVREHPPRWIRG